MEIIIWLLSLIIFSWCYSTLFNCLFNLSIAPTMKISAVIYLAIIAGLYAIAYYFLNQYLTDILVCSGIAGVLSLFAARK